MFGATLNTNGRCKSLLDLVVSSELLICTSGNDPTFLNRVRKNIIDITLCSVSVAHFTHCQVPLPSLKENWMQLLTEYNTETRLDGPIRAPGGTSVVPISPRSSCVFMSRLWP